MTNRDMEPEEETFELDGKTVGQILRETRESKGLSTSKAADAVRLKVQHIESMENDDFDRLPAPIYAKAFIKLYAKYLGIEHIPLVQYYQAHFTPKGGSTLLPSNAKKTPPRRIDPVNPAGGVRIASTAIPSKNRSAAGSAAAQSGAPPAAPVAEGTKRLTPADSSTKRVTPAAQVQTPPPTIRLEYEQGEPAASESAAVLKKDSDKPAARPATRRLQPPAKGTKRLILRNTEMPRQTVAVADRFKAVAVRFKAVVVRIGQWDLQGKLRTLAGSIRLPAISRMLLIRIGTGLAALALICVLIYTIVILVNMPPKSKSKESLITLTTPREALDLGIIAEPPPVYLSTATPEAPSSRRNSDTLAP